MIIQKYDFQNNSKDNKRKGRKEGGGGLQRMATKLIETPFCITRPRLQQLYISYHISSISHLLRSARIAIAKTNGARTEWHQKKNQMQ
jgi:hypothetical protein